MRKMTLRSGESRERWVPPWLKVSAWMFGTLVVLNVIAWLVLDLLTRAELEDALASWEAKGRPTELADPYPNPIPPNDMRLHQGRAM